MQSGLSHLVQGGGWMAVYLALVLIPLVVLLLAPVPPGLGFWWDFSLALGFAGTAMMGIQFALTARFRRATAPYGIDIVYYVHRYLALVGLVLIVAHPLVLILLNPPFVHLLNPFDAPWHMTAGVVSVAALITIVVTSWWRKQLRIEYDGWRRWHAALAIVALTLALVHIHAVGYYSAPSWKRGLWGCMILSWLAVLVYVRLLRPWRLLRTPYRVSEVLAERGDAWTIVLHPDGHAGMPIFEPGQFAWVTLRASPFAFAEHPFSISSSPSAAGALAFTIKELGDFTRTIKTVQIGEIAYVDGPYGAFSIDRYPAAAGYVFIAGGIGSAPMMSMLRALADRGDQRPHLLVLANSRWERVTFREAALALASRLNLRIVQCLEEPPAGWDGETGYVTAAVLERCLPADRRRHEYFVCGPEPMIATVEQALYRVGVPLTRFHTELFDLV